MKPILATAFSVCLTAVGLCLGSASLRGADSATQKPETATHRAVFPAGVRRVLFLGDSITYGGTYVSMVETYFVVRNPDLRIEFINVGLPSETVSGLTEDGHAGGRFPRPDLHERLSRVLEQTKPDFVFACYGINDGIYLPLNDQRFQKFKIGTEWLHQQVKATGAKIVHLTPPTFDGSKSGNTNYNDVLSAYSKWLISRRADGWDVIDIHGPMDQFLAEHRRGDPAFALAGDGVHPGDLGHFIMARQILLHLGAMDLPDPANIDAITALHKNGAEILKLVSERQGIMKDAWLTATRHTRPEMSVGLPLADAKLKASELAARLHSLQ